MHYVLKMNLSLQVEDQVKVIAVINHLQTVHLKNI